MMMVEGMNIKRSAEAKNVAELLKEEELKTITPINYHNCILHSWDILMFHPQVADR